MCAVGVVPSAQPGGGRPSAPARELASIQGRSAAFHRSERRQKLGQAFPAIDRLMQEFARREHVPGAAWGIVIDGELAHLGVAGSRDLATKAPVDARHACSASRR